MASLKRYPSGNFHLAFQFGGSRFKRSLKTKSQCKGKGESKAACSRIEENIALIEAGRTEQLFSTFEETVPADSMEATSLYTARMDMNH